MWNQASALPRINLRLHASLCVFFRWIIEGESVSLLKCIDDSADVLAKKIFLKNKEKILATKTKKTKKGKISAPVWEKNRWANCGSLLLQTRTLLIRHYLVPRACSLQGKLVSSPTAPCKNNATLRLPEIMLTIFPSSNYKTWCQNE